MTTTAYRDHTVTRGNAFKPGVLRLVAEDDQGFSVDVPVSAFANLYLKIWKNRPKAQPDGIDEDLVTEVSLTPSADGQIMAVGANEVQLLVHDQVTALWAQNEYFYAVGGPLTVDGEWHDVVKGRILVAWGNGNPLP